MRYQMLITAMALLTWLGCGVGAAQETVHALSGTFQKVDLQTKTMQVATNDGSEGTFSFSSGTTKTDVDFERDVKDRVTPVASFSKTNEQIVVYYYGNGNVRTAVGVQDLGVGPLDTVEGIVTKFDKHRQQISIRDSSGKEHAFQIASNAMADSPGGAIPASRLSASKGDNVRIIATKASGAESAIFIRD